MLMIATGLHFSTLSLHDALPIFLGPRHGRQAGATGPDHAGARRGTLRPGGHPRGRSEEHTSELQSLRHLVCRLLLEKKKVAQIFTKAVVRRMDADSMTRKEDSRETL